MSDTEFAAVKTKNETRVFCKTEMMLIFGVYVVSVQQHTLSSAKLVVRELTALQVFLQCFDTVKGHLACKNLTPAFQKNSSLRDLYYHHLQLSYILVNVSKQRIFNYVSEMNIFNKL